MGMSASQARLLFVSSRINDVEFKSQQIANTKMRLAAETEEVANNYTRALNQTKLMFSNPVNQSESQLTYASIMTPGGQMSGNYNIQTKDGKVVVTSQIASAFESSSNLTEFLASMSVQKSDTTIASEEFIQAEANLKEAKGNVTSYKNTVLTPNQITVGSNNKLNFPVTTKETVNTVDKSGSAKAGGPTSVADGVADGKVSTVESKSSAGGAGGVSNVTEARTIDRSSSSSSTGVSSVTTSSKVETTESVSSSGHVQTVTTTTTGVHKIDLVDDSDSGGRAWAEVEGTDTYKVTTKTVIQEHVFTSAQEAKFQKDYDDLLRAVGTAQTAYNTALETYSNTGNGQLNESSTGNEYYYTNLYNTMSSKGYEAYSVSELNSPEYLQMQLEYGNWYIGQKNDKGEYENISLSANNRIFEKTDDSQIAKAEAEYNAETAKINRKEKMLDMQQKNLDTEHTALQTEFDSLKTLIGDNVEKSFNLFS